MEQANSPATKQDVEQVRSEVKLVRAEIKQDVEQLRLDVKQDIEQLRSEMNHRYRDLVERITDSETKLLKVFYNFGVTNNQRMVELEGNDEGLRRRIGTIEVRLLEVERRLKMPPTS